MALRGGSSLLTRGTRHPVFRSWSGVRSYRFLPSSYHLEDVWQKRLTTPLMRDIRIEEFYVELRKKFEADKSGSPLDMDIFANGVVQPDSLLHLEELLAYFRKSRNTKFMRRSTSDAVVRAFMDQGYYEELMKIIDNKVIYGIFLDYYTANLLMDKSLELKRYPDAVRVAIDFMLQEDFGHPLTRNLSLYSCLAFLQNPDWTALAPLNPPVPPPDTGEEVLVYVPFLKNEFFDDHFDLTDPKARLGKTLMTAGAQSNDLLGRSARLMGAGLYKKWEKGVKILTNLNTASADNGTVLSEAVDSFLEALKQQPEPPEDEKVAAERLSWVGKAEELQRSLRPAGKLKEGKLLDLAEAEVKKVVEQSAETDISTQQSLYEKWMTQRENEVNRQMRQFELTERLKQLQAKRQQLQAEEDVLFFFERKNQWEKMLSPEARRSLLDQQVRDGSHYDYRVEDPAYHVEQIKPPTTWTKTRYWKTHQDKYDEKKKAIIERFGADSLY
ncbi:hypothetical protein RvY_02953 [Ramazzottius varieornatus]|uniref:28S ribosomal protein S27, mitochondrial n=1 Tax=Ramazzottius varieornatus TaxID=947166 RepID=A0A1D1UM87_RAMVA|nr:hypothetical protein RvY_02953 [Ramazzottius varieornatus]